VKATPGWASDQRLSTTHPCAKKPCLGGCSLLPVKVATSPSLMVVWVFGWRVKACGHTEDGVEGTSSMDVIKVRVGLRRYRAKGRGHQGVQGRRVEVLVNTSRWAVCGKRLTTNTAGTACLSTLQTQLGVATFHLPQHQPKGRAASLEGVPKVAYVLHAAIHVLHSTAQHSTAQHSTAQHSTAQHSSAQRFACHMRTG
jgi:hypothetical protein